jgi:DNA-binding beta-propeller fold protein YncE
MTQSLLKNLSLMGSLVFAVALQAADGPLVNGQNAENVVGQSTPEGGPDFDNVGPYDTALLTGLHKPYDVTIDTISHRLFVADAAHRILVYDLDSSNILVDRTPDNVLGQADLYGDALGTTQNRLYYPTGLDFDANSNRLFVADYSNSRVLIFDVTTITDGENAINVLGQPDFTTRTALTTQNGIYTPYDVKFVGTPGNDLLFVSNYGNHRVLVYDVTTITNGENAINVLGQSDFTTGTSGLTQSQFNGPNYLEKDSTSNRLFVSDRNNNRVLVFDISSITDGENAINVIGQTTFTSGSSARTQSRLSSTRGLSFDRGTQRLFVSDNSNNRTLVFDVASITNGENAINVLGQPDFTSGTVATSQNGFSGPIGNVLDANRNRLYVGDYLNNRILSFDVSTTTIVNGANAVNVVGQTDESGGPVYTRSYDFDRAAQNGFLWAYDVAIDTVSHRLFVGDYTSNRVLVYNLDTNNSIVDRTADYVLGQTNFINQDIMTNQYSTYRPTGLAFDAETNRLFVVCRNSHRVMVFDVASITNGENAVNVLGQTNFTSAGATTTQSRLNGPYGVALEPGTSRLYVTASGNNRVLVYDVSTITDGENAINVLGQADFTSTSYGLSQNRLRNPTSATHDGNNHLFVAEYWNNRVLVFDTTAITDGENAVHVLGQPDFTSDTASLTAAAFSPWGVATDPSSNRLFVSDPANNRLLVFDTTVITDGEDAVNVLGQSDFTTGTEGYTASKLNFPMGLAYEPGMNRLYISDQENNRVLVHSVGPVPPSTSTVTAGMGSQAGAIDLSWPSAGDDGMFNPLTGFYRIQYSTMAATAWSTSATPAGAYTTTLPATGVTPGVVQSTTVIVGLDQPWYFVLWTQDDASNWSAISATASASPYQPPPLPATAVFTTRSENTITANWASSVGASSYTFVVSTTADNPPVSVAGSSNTLALSATVASLTPNTTYFGFVNACDAVGCSAYTAFGSTVTWANPPTTLSTTSLASTSLSLAWGANGNPAGTIFQIEQSTGSGAPYSFAVSTAGVTASISGLSPGTTACFRILAQSFDGVPTAPTSELCVVPPFSTPGPASFSAAGTAAVLGAWTSAPGATFYTFNISTAPDNPPLAVIGSSTTASLTAAIAALTPNTTYYGFAKGCNGVDCSADTALGSAVTDAAVPNTLASGTVTAVSMALSFNINGNPLGTSFEIELATDGVTFASILSTTSAAPTLSGLTPGLTYTVRVRAVNYDAVATAYSPTLEVPTSGTLPAAPVNLLGTAGSGGITYTWDPVTTNALGNPLPLGVEVHYEFSASDTPTGTFSVLALSTATAYGPVTAAGVEHFYRVRTEAETLYSVPTTIIDNVGPGRYVFSSVVGTAVTTPQGLLTGVGNPRHVVSLTDQPLTDGALVAVDIAVLDGTTGTPATNVTFSPSGQLTVPLPDVTSGERSVEYFNGSAWVLAGTAHINAPNMAQFSFGRTGPYRLMGAPSGDVVHSVIARVFTPNGDGRNDVTVIRLNNPNGDPTHGTIYDSDGARVADMATGPAPGLSLMWDGRDANGASIPGGVYIYQVTVGSRRSTGTIVVVK